MKSIRQYRGERCLNCSHSIDVSDRYCPNCGQLNSNKELTAKQMLTEFLASIFSYDSKLFKSLKLLLISPAKIAIEFLKGKRASYVNPFRFFISVAIVYFLLSSILAPNIDKSEFENNFKSTESVEDSNDVKKDSLNTENKLVVGSENAKLKINISENKTTKSNSFLNKLQTLFLENVENSKQNPQAFIDFMLPKIPFVLFFLMPFISLISRLFYWRRSFSYTEHLVLNYYLFSTFFIVFSLSELFSALFDYDFGWLFFLVNVIYILRTFKQFYKQNYFKTILKLVFIFIADFILIVVGLISFVITLFFFY